MHPTTGLFRCPDCPSTFDREEHCERHWHFEHSSVVYNCPDCNKKSENSSNLRDHIQKEHPNSIYALFGIKPISERKPKPPPLKNGPRVTHPVPRSDEEELFEASEQDPGVNDILRTRSHVQPPNGQQHLVPVISGSGGFNIPISPPNSKSPFTYPIKFCYLPDS